MLKKTTIVTIILVFFILISIILISVLVDIVPENKRTENKDIADTDIAVLPESVIDITTSYHQSQFFEYAELIKNSIEEAKTNDEINLDKVFGGIVPHHIPTATPLIANFYNKLKNTKDIKTFIVLGPDHIDSGKGDISISTADFITPFGTLKTDHAIFESLEKSGLAIHDETPFNKEHSIDAQLSFVSKIFPEVKVVPIVFRSSVTDKLAKKFGEVLADSLSDDVFIIASVDFSHYLSENQARPIDQFSANILGAINPQISHLVKSDSTQAITALVSAMETKGATHYTETQTQNTADFNNNTDFTTGYIVGFFGANHKEITIMFTGDIMLSRAVGSKTEKSGDWRYPFLKVGNFLSSADLTFGNLEGPISGQGTNMGSKYPFRADPRMIEGLNYAGFDIMTIANNHIWDYGQEAFADTMNILKNNKVDFVGGGVDYNSVHQPLIKNIENTKIAFLGYTDLIPDKFTTQDSKPATASIDIEQITTDVKKAKELSDIVITNFHWGNEYQTQHNQKQEDIAKTTIDAGADLIIGHHPHVIQEIEQYNNKYIAYSLGNFVFDQNFSATTQKGIIIKTTIKDKKIDSIESIDVKISNEFQTSVISMEK